jgi:chromosome partitioning protein
MITFALLCQKGDSGKSTLALHLAAKAATTGRRALVLHLDPQASSARWADRRQADDLPSVDVAVESQARLTAALTQAAVEAYDLVLRTPRHMPIRHPYRRPVLPTSC